MWSYGPEAQQILTSFDRLRYELLPYIYSAAWRVTSEGYTIMRPLVMDFPDDVRTWPVDDAYLLGEGLLAAPLVAGETARSVYLPAGEWYDYWSGERHAGGQRVDVRPSLEQVPLFVRAGTLLPLAHPTLHTDDPQSGELTVLAYGAADATCTLYEDDGAHPAALTEVVLSWNAARRAGTVRRTGIERAPHYRVVEWTTIA